MKLLALLVCAAMIPASAAHRAAKPKAESPIDAAIRAARPSAPPSSGSLYSDVGWFSDGYRDLRAARVSDLVTIVVSDQASAVSTGTTKTSRKSSAQASVTSLAGPLRAAGPLANLANLGGSTSLDGQGTTSRTSSLTTTITAVVSAVLPNGNLVVEGRKEIAVNSEHQTVTVRGIVRPVDLSPVNSISSDRVGLLEVKVNGKGVVADSARRPFILYRILLGLLPF